MNFYLSGDKVLWLAKVVEDSLWVSSLTGSIQSKREGDRVLLVQLGHNSYGRFLKLIEFGNRAKKGFLAIPEGHKGCGWASFAKFAKDVVGLLVFVS